MVSKRILFLSLFLVVMLSISSHALPVFSSVEIEIIEVFSIKDKEKVKEIVFSIPFREHFSEFVIRECVNCEVKYNNTHLIAKAKNWKDGINNITIKLLLNQSLILPYKKGTEELSVYTQPTPNIQSSSPKIMQLSKYLYNNCSNELCYITNTVEWIHRNIKYDLKYADNNYDALWVLKNRVGVCAEYTTLFIALMRSKNIPARYNSVFAYYSQSDEYIPHAYAEVYINNTWYPVDVLWKQIGFVDANHIYRAYSTSNQINSRVNVKFEGNGNVFSWIEEKYNIKKIEIKHENIFEIPNQSIELPYNTTKHVNISVISPYKNICVFVKGVVCKGANITISPETFLLCDYKPKRIILKSYEKRKILCNITLNYENKYSIIEVKTTYKFLDSLPSSLPEEESAISWFKKLLMRIISLINSL